MSAESRWLRAGAVAALVVLVDQVTKALVSGSIAVGERRPLFAGVSLVHAKNSGVAFSLFTGSELAVVLLTIAIVGCVLAYFATHLRQRLMWLASGMIIGGAIGNLADRVRAGAVTDFIKLPAWPAFNVADASITLGVIVLILLLSRGGVAARTA